MQQLNVALALMGLTAIAIALLSAAIKRSPLSEPVLSVAVGLIGGPYVLGWLDPAEWAAPDALLEQASRFTLAIGLMGVALRIRGESLRRLARPIALLLLPGMLGMWLVSAVLIGWLLDVPLWLAVLLGALVTPTDPVVASTITGRFAETHLPLRLRDGLSLEAGANHGLAFAFVLLPILLLDMPDGAAWQRWLVETLLIDVLGAALLGTVIGYAAAKLMRLAERHKLMASTSLLGYTLAFTLFTVGAAALLGTEAQICVFLAGLVFNLCSSKREEHEEENIQEAVAKLFTLPMFVLFGVLLPLNEWHTLGWPLALLSAALLVLRRLPVLLLLGPALRGWYHRHDVVFLGWFGPVGIATIFYAALAEKHVGDPHLWPVASAVIVASVVAHGLSAAPLTRFYARHPGTPPPRTRGLDEAEENG